MILMKNKNLQEVYKIIPPDCLHQVEGEDHRTPLSEEEIDFIISYCVDNDMGNMDEYILPIIRKFELARIASITTERFLEGKLDILTVDEDGDIIWKAK